MIQRGDRMLIGKDIVRRAAAVAMMLCCIAAARGERGTQLNSDSRHVFNVRDFAAKGDGETLDTAAVQAAVDECADASGGIVYVPAGRYLCGTVFLKSNVTLQLAPQAVLLGSGRLADYSDKTKGPEYYPFFNKCLLYGEKASKICLRGTGTINGQGHLYPPGDTTHRPCSCGSSTVRTSPLTACASKPRARGARSTSTVRTSASPGL